MALPPLVHYATRHTRDEVARRIQTLQAEHDALPEQIRVARDS